MQKLLSWYNTKSLKLIYKQMCSNWREGLRINIKSLILLQTTLKCQFTLHEKKLPHNTERIQLFQMLMLKLTSHIFQVSLLNFTVLCKYDFTIGIHRHCRLLPTKLKVKENPQLWTHTNPKYLNNGFLYCQSYNSNNLTTDNLVFDKKVIP